MKRIRIEDATPGMVLATAVVTPKGQLIAAKGKSLNSQVLLHMRFYNISEIDVEEAAIIMDEKEEDDDFIRQTQSWKIRHSEEFERFKIAYTVQIENFESLISDFVKHQKPLAQEELLSGTREIFSKNNTSISMLNMLLNMREIDDCTYAHSVNVAITARIMGSWLGYDKEDLDALTMAGLCHDLGKCVIDNSILGKPGKLTPEEYKEMQKHPLLGYELLKDQPVDNRIKLAALQHHEKFDGSGYPFGLPGENISDFAAIIAIADIYDAMTADRVYRKAMCPFDVIAEFQRRSFELYNPKFIMVFLNRIADAYSDSACILSDGRRGKIIMINSNDLTRPLLQMENKEFVDLREHPDLYVEAVL